MVKISVSHTETKISTIYITFKSTSLEIAFFLHMHTFLSISSPSEVLFQSFSSILSEVSGEDTVSIQKFPTWVTILLCLLYLRMAYCRIHLKLKLKLKPVQTSWYRDSGPESIQPTENEFSTNHSTVSNTSFKRWTGDDVIQLTNHASIRFICVSVSVSVSIIGSGVSDNKP